MTSTQAFDFAIIGGGAAGTLLAVRLLQAAPAGMRIAMIESGEPGRGVAYGSDNPAHVLNVPAGGMSMFTERPDDFVVKIHHEQQKQRREGQQRSERRLRFGFYNR